MVTGQKLIVYWLAAIIAVIVAFPADSDSPSLRHRYFLVVWGYQEVGNPPRESHTFLTVYRGDDLAKGRVAPATISWFPATGVVHLVGVDRGRNVSLRKTLHARVANTLQPGDLMKFPRLSINGP